ENGPLYLKLQQTILQIVDAFRIGAKSQPTVLVPCGGVSREYTMLPDTHRAATAGTFPKMRVEHYPCCAFRSLGTISVSYQRMSKSAWSGRRRAANAALKSSLSSAVSGCHAAVTARVAYQSVIALAVSAVMPSSMT